MLLTGLFTDRETTDCRVSTSLPGFTGNSGFGTVAQAEKVNTNIVGRITCLITRSIFLKGITAPVFARDYVSQVLIIAQPDEGMPPI
jgi:hypothetical protein